MTIVLSQRLPCTAVQWKLSWKSKVLLSTSFFLAIQLNLSLQSKANILDCFNSLPTHPLGYCNKILKISNYQVAPQDLQNTSTVKTCSIIILTCNRSLSLSPRNRVLIQRSKAIATRAVEEEAGDGKSLRRDLSHSHSSCCQAPARLQDCSSQDRLQRFQPQSCSLSHRLRQQVQRGTQGTTQKRYRLTFCCHSCSLSKYEVLGKGIRQIIGRNQIQLAQLCITR